MKKEHRLLAVVTGLVAIGISISSIITAVELGKIASVVSENSQMRIERQELAVQVLKQQEIIKELMEAQTQGPRGQNLFLQH